MTYEREEKRPSRGGWIVVALAVAGVVCILLAVVVTAWAVQAQAERRRREAIKRSGAQAALILAEHGRNLIDTYVNWSTDHSTNKWMIFKLDKALPVTKGAPGPGEVVELTIHFGSTLLASSSSAPGTFKGSPEESPYPGVKVCRGLYTKGGVSFPCFTFEVGIDNPGSSTRGVARVIVRLED